MDLCRDTDDVKQNVQKSEKKSQNARCLEYNGSSVLSSTQQSRAFPNCF